MNADGVVPDADTLTCMVPAAVFWPHPPLLVPALAAGAAGELDALRAACASALHRAHDGRRQLVLLGAGERSLAHSPLARGSLAPFGVDVEVTLGSSSCGGRVELPASLAVGAWLLGQVLGPRTGAVGFSVGPDFAGSRAAAALLELAETRELTLVVLADGSARRGESAPGFLDPRACGFDASVAAALRDGDATALAGLDAGLGAELLAAGVPAWHAAASLLGGARYDAELRYDAAPYGVGYFVACWRAA